MARTDMEAADSQLLEKARETLRRGSFVRKDADKDRTISVSVIERSGTETVTANLEWGQAPTCTCTSYWTSVRLGMGPWCRHVVAVLVREEELRCQLIDLLL